jgi:hypothetical protein
MGQTERQRWLLRFGFDLHLLRKHPKILFPPLWKHTAFLITDIDRLMMLSKAICSLLLEPNEDHKYTVRQTPCYSTLSRCYIQLPLCFEDVRSGFQTFVNTFCYSPRLAAVYLYLYRLCNTLLSRKRGFVGLELELFIHVPSPWC